MFKFRRVDYKKQTDERLMLAIQNGDDQAFSELYDRYNERLLYYFYKMLGNDNEIARDFVQELFYKLIDKTHLFDPKKKLSTWIFSIAHNMCKNEYRSRNVRSVIEKVENTDRYIVEEENVKNDTFDVEQIFECLKQFDEVHQTAFILKYREGLSIDEIAEILELPKGTVKSRLFYTRRKLQEQLKPIAI